MELGVDHHVMNIIEHDQPNDCRKCCHDILDDWLNRNPAASWEALILAIVRLPTCGMRIFCGVCCMHLDAKTGLLNLISCFFTDMLHAV